MKLHYFTDTDTLYIAFRDGPAVETTEIAGDVLVDYAADGSIVGVTVDLASSKTDMDSIELVDLSNVHVIARANARAAATTAP